MGGGDGFGVRVGVGERTRARTRGRGRGGVSFRALMRALSRLRRYPCRGHRWGRCIRQRTGTGRWRCLRQPQSWRREGTTCTSCFRLHPCTCPVGKLWQNACACVGLAPGVRSARSTGACTGAGRAGVAGVAEAVRRRGARGAACVAVGDARRACVGPACRLERRIRTLCHANIHTGRGRRMGQTGNCTVSGTCRRVCTGAGGGGHIGPPSNAVNGGALEGEGAGVAGAARAGGDASSHRRRQVGVERHLRKADRCRCQNPAA